MTAPDLDDWSLGRLVSTAARLIEHDWNDWLANHDLGWTTDFRRRQSQVSVPS